MRKHYNIVIANAPINNGNRGCVALGISAMYLIANILKEANIDYTFFCDAQFQDRQEHKIRIGKDVLSFIDCGKSYSVDLKGRLKFLIRYPKAVFDYSVFDNADFVLDLGQGDSFADIYGSERFNMIFCSYLLAEHFKIPMCILPQTIGPFENKEIRDKAIGGINYASLVLARDKQSLNYTKELVPTKEVKEVIDVAFFLPYEKIEQDKDFIHIGLNVSALLWNGGYLRNNQFGLKCDYSKLIRSIIDYFLSIQNVKVHIIPHVVDAERCIENDYAVSYDLWREYHDSRLVLAPFALSPIDIKSYISGMDFFMGARMHATIGAFSSGVPVVPMAYSRKFNGLFEETLDYHYMVDMKVMTYEDILSAIIKAYDDRMILKSKIGIRNATIVNNKRNSLNNELRKFFGII